VALETRYVLAGPVEGVMKQASGANTGGLQTSTLAAGLADGAISFLEGEASSRLELNQSAEALRSESDQLQQSLLRAAAGDPACSTEELRRQANSLVLRATQAALVAAKGAGYVVGHPAGRWCREALFFLVWSCPQSVLEANLCELAGLSD
jgi:alkylation response protein AidB-like acyl-CoA dehydrogenase